MPDEPIVFKPKKSATRVKHQILESYLSAWGGIIIHKNPGRVRLRFVDTFCGSGLYQPDPDFSENPDAYEVGSAILGPTALFKLVEFGRGLGRDMSAKALLINNEKKELATVSSALPADVRAAVEVVPRVKKFDDVKEEVLKFCYDSFSFVLIDPYGPSIPYASIRDIVRGKYTDTLINFPFLTLQRWSGFLFKKSPNDEEVRRLATIDAFMGGEDWREAARKAKAESLPLDEILLDLYVARLKREGVHVLSLPLFFERIDRVIYHLIFTTHNVAGLAAAKKHFVEAKDEELKLRSELEMRRTGQGTLEFMTVSTESAADEEQLAERLFSRFAGTHAPFADIVLFGLEECVLESDVKKALTVLKTQGHVSYPTPRYGQAIVFSKRT